MGRKKEKEKEREREIEKHKFDGCEFVWYIYSSDDLSVHKKVWTMCALLW